MAVFEVLAVAGLLGGVLDAWRTGEAADKNKHVQKLRAGLIYRESQIDEVFSKMNMENLKTYTDGLDQTYSRNEELLLTEFEQGLAILEEQQGVLDLDLERQGEFLGQRGDLAQQRFADQRQIFTRREAYANQGFGQEQAHIQAQREASLLQAGVDEELIRSQSDQRRVGVARGRNALERQLIGLRGEEVGLQAERLGLDAQGIAEYERRLGLQGQGADLADRRTGLDSRGLDLQRGNIDNYLRRIGLRNKGLDLGDRRSGLDEQAIGLGERGVDLQDREIGLHESGVGLKESLVALDEKEIGLEERGIGLEGKLLQLLGKRLGISEKNVGLAEAGLGLKDQRTSLYERTIALQRSAVGLEEAGLGLSEKSVGIGERRIGLGEQEVGINQEGINLQDRKISLEQSLLRAAEEGITHESQIERLLNEKEGVELKRDELNTQSGYDIAEYEREQELKAKTYGKQADEHMLRAANTEAEADAMREASINTRHRRANETIANLGRLKLKQAASGFTTKSLSAKERLKHMRTESAKMAISEYSSQIKAADRKGEEVKLHTWNADIATLNEEFAQWKGQEEVNTMSLINGIKNKQFDRQQEDLDIAIALSAKKEAMSTINMESFISGRIDLVSRQEEQVHTKRGLLHTRNGMLDQRDQIVQLQNDKLEARESLRQAEEQLVRSRHETLSEREGLLGQRQQITAQQGQLIDAEEGLVGREFETLNKRYGIVDQQRGLVGERFDLLGQRFGTLDQRRGLLGARQDVLGQRYERQAGREGLLQEEFAAQDAYDNIHAQRFDILGRQYDTQGQRESLLGGRFEAQDARDRNLAQRYGIVDQRQSLLGDRYSVLQSDSRLMDWEMDIIGTQESARLLGNEVKFGKEQADMDYREGQAELNLNRELLSLFASDQEAQRVMEGTMIDINSKAWANQRNYDSASIANFARSQAQTQAYNRAMLQQYKSQLGDDYNLNNRLLGESKNQALAQLGALNALAVREQGKINAYAGYTSAFNAGIGGFTSILGAVGDERWGEPESEA